MSLSEAYTEKPEMDWKDKMALEYDCDRWENILAANIKSDNPYR